MAASPRSPALRHEPAAVVALLALTIFLAILIAENFLQPDLSPLTHQVSEYANHSGGWLMRLALLIWAASLGACALVQTHRRPLPLAIKVSAAILTLACAALVLTALFDSQTVAGRLPPRAHLTSSGRLHDVGSGVATVAIAGAAITDALAPSTNSKLRRLTCAVVAVAVVCDLGLLVVGPNVGGLRERVLIGLGCLWQAEFAWGHRRAES